MTGIKERIRLERTSTGYGFSLNFKHYEVIATTESGVNFFEDILKAELYEDSAASLLWTRFLNCVAYKQYEVCIGVAWGVVEQILSINPITRMAAR